MTGFTHRGALNMRGMLTGSRCAVVTSRAVTGNRGVIKVGRYPAAGGVTVGTIISADDMIAVFAGCDIAVVTAHAGPLNMRVIDSGGGGP